MKELDIQGAMPAKKSKPITTTSDKDGKYPPDQVKRQFYASAPNQLWVSDITYVRTLVGWCYVALITDLFSKKIVGFMVSDQCDTKLVLGALCMAIGNAGSCKGLVHHSDRGSQYFSLKYTDMLNENLVIQSTGITGCSFDNAAAESTNSRYKAELIHNKNRPIAFRDYSHVEDETAKYISWWNNRRIQERLGFITPEEFIDNYYNSQEVA